MIPTKISPCIRELGRPAGTLEEDCSSLQISDVQDPIWGNLQLSAWQPSDEERAAIANGAPVILSVVGRSHPVVSLFVGAWEGEASE